MIELIKSGVVFDEENHTYTLDGKMLSGITGMIGRQLFPDKYKDIPDFILQRAAEKGRRIHSQCEFADVTGLPPESVEAENYIMERTNSGYISVANEYTVSDNMYFATNIDCVWGKDDLVSLVDIKTTYHLDREYLSWQLSINAYLFEKQNPHLKVYKLYGLWLRGDKSDLVEIGRKPDNEVERLLQCEINGTRYLSSEIVPINKIQLIPAQIVDILIDMQEELSFMEERKKNIMATLKNAMSENGINVWDAGRLRVSIVGASTKKTFDSKSFQSDYPELYTKYLIESVTKESIRLTIRKEKDAE